MHRLARPATQGISAGMCLLVCAAVAGCFNAPSDPRITQIQQLEDKVQSQGRLLSQKDDQLAEQSRMVQQLRGLKDDRKLDSLVRVAKIELDRLSGTYDDNRDGTPDGIVLYLRMYDDEADVIKAAGSARVRLMDLAKPDGQQTLGTHDFDAKTMRGLWYGKLMTSHYTIRIPWAKMSGPPQHPKVTVLVSFTESLSGRSFELQQVLDVAPSASAQK
jgi:hypothetical protein